MPSIFAEKVYTKLRKMPEGKVTTYKALAEAVGTKAYRAIGQVMHNNPYSPRVPCHRVIANDRTIGGFASGTAKKIKMLKSEGITIVNGKVDEKHIIRKL